MSNFQSCLEAKSIKAAFIKRNASVMELNNTVGKIQMLNTSNPSLRQFTYIDKEFEVNMEQLKGDNHLFVQHILHASQNFSSDAEFTEDQKSIRATQIAAINAKDSYLEILENHNLVPKISDQVANAAPVPTSPDLAAILKELAEDRKNQKETLKALLDSQTQNQNTQAATQKSLLIELNKNQAAATKAATGPKPTQPFFHPKGDMSDYLSYKSFIKKFDYFSVNVVKNVDKLWWLLSSVKGDAYELIKNLSLEGINYQVALDKLQKIYLDDDKIKQSIVSSIYNYKNPNPDKNYSNVLKGLTSLENHLAELKGVHEIDCYEPAANLIVSHIIFSNLPGQLKNELMNACNTLYPTLAQIFDKIPKVVDKVNLINNNEPNSKKSKDNSDNQILSANAKPFVSINTVNESNDAQDAQSIFTTDPIKIESIFVPATPDHDIGIYSATSKLQRAVALQTAVFAAVNPEASEVPIYERNIAILADTAAQRSLVTKELASKLKLPIIAHERASIQGYGQVKAES